jgi:hypothetical protein
VFNEILTGKATLEPPPSPVQPGVVHLDVEHSCVRCTKSYLAKSGSAPAHCPSCHAIVVQENAAESARAYNAAAANIRSSEASVRLFKLLLVIAAAIVFGFIKYSMRKQMRDDNAAAAARYSHYDDTPAYDEYSSTVEDFSREMCRCSDAMCASQIRNRFQMWQRRQAGVEESSMQAAEPALQRMASCLADLSNR